MPDLTASPTTIRLAARRDLGELLPLIRAFAHHRGEIATATEAELRRDLFGPTRLLDLFVACRGAGLVGYLAAARFYRAQHARRCIEIQHLHVREEVRGEGIAEALVTACLDYAAHLGCAEAVAGPPSGAAALSALSGLGFRPGAGVEPRLSRPIEAR
jgi:GNAT superfamily N-acetyltransferase